MVHYHTIASTYATVVAALANASIPCCFPRIAIVYAAAASALSLIRCASHAAVLSASPAAARAAASAATYCASEVDVFPARMSIAPCR